MRKLVNRFVSFILAGVFLSYSGSVSAGRYHGNRRSKPFYKEREAVRRETVVEKVVAVPAPAPAVVPAGPKKLIAVAEFSNKTNWSGQVNLGTGMADQLITALMDTNRFMVLERQSIDAVLREQNFAASSRTTEEGAAHTGSISRAQILIQGAITEFEQNENNNGGGITVGGVTFSSSEASAHVAVDVRIYDTTTGQILASKACKGTAKKTAGGIGYVNGDFGLAAGGGAKTPLDFAVRDAIAQAVHFILLELDKVPWEGRIAMIKGNNIFINCGRTAGIKEGDRFSVYRPGEAIIDPETGINLGSEKKLSGEIEVVKVEEKFSYAAAVAGTGFRRNDIIKYGPHPVGAAPVPAQ